MMQIPGIHEAPVRHRILVPLLPLQYELEILAQIILLREDPPSVPCPPLICPSSNATARSKYKPSSLELSKIPYLLRKIPQTFINVHCKISLLKFMLNASTSFKQAALYHTPYQFQLFDRYYINITKHQIQIKAAISSVSFFFLFFISEKRND
jgi:hypothetical protein